MKNQPSRSPAPGSPAAIQSKLIQLEERIGSEPVHQFVHPQQNQIPEWCGADVRVTSDFVWEPANFVEAHDLLVRTRHAGALTWLLLELRDAFAGWLDAGNKYGFYGGLAEAALSHLAANQPEVDEAKPLLKAVLAQAFIGLQTLQEYGGLPSDLPIVIHQRDAEGRQSRIAIESGQDRP